MMNDLPSTVFVSRREGMISAVMPFKIEGIATEQASLDDPEVQSYLNPGPVITDVTRAQALMALHQAGRLQTVRSIVANHDLEEVRIWFENALNWKRSNPYVLAIAAELELTDEQVDDLFITAASFV